MNSREPCDKKKLIKTHMLLIIWNNLSSQEICINPGLLPFEWLGGEEKQDFMIILCVEKKQKRKKRHTRHSSGITNPCTVKIQWADKLDRIKSSWSILDHCVYGLESHALKSRAVNRYNNHPETNLLQHPFQTLQGTHGMHVQNEKEAWLNVKWPNKIYFRLNLKGRRASEHLV